MDWLRSKTTAIAGGCLALIALQGYGLMSTREAVNERIASAEREFQSARAQDDAKVAQLASALDEVKQRMGNTAQGLEEVHTLAQKLNQENTQTAQRLRREIAAKANAQSVKQLQDEATSKLAEVEQDTSAKIGAVTGEVQAVRTDLNATREDLANSKKDLSSQIAHNAGELAELR